MQVLLHIKTTINKMDIFARNNISILDDPRSENKIAYLPFSDYAVLLRVDDVVELRQCLLHNMTNSLIPQVQTLLSKQVSPIRKAIPTSRDVEGLKSLMLLPNNKCNFHCSYCYSANGRTNKEIDINVLEASLRYFLNPERAKGERLSITVLGGGEPLLSWKILKTALNKAMLTIEQRESACPISLVTNGSICTDEIIQYCLRHNISLSISFDILEDVQNSQRGFWKEVSANINRFAESGLDVALNTVISNENVARMSEMIEHLARFHKKVKKVSFKTLITKKHFHNIEERRKYYQEFICNFFKAKTVADQYEIWLTCSYMNTCLCLVDRYCPGKFVVTSEGDISTCHTVGSKRDELYDDFIFGHIDENTGDVNINDDKLRNILSYDVTKNDGCSECAARWHCAGGCYADRFHLSKEEHSAYCKSMNSFLAHFLIYKFKL